MARLPEYFRQTELSGVPAFAYIASLRSATLRAPTISRAFYQFAFLD